MYPGLDPTDPRYTNLQKRYKAGKITKQERDDKRRNLAVEQLKERKPQRGKLPGEIHQDILHQRSRKGGKTLKIKN